MMSASLIMLIHIVINKYIKKDNSDIQYIMSADCRYILVPVSTATWRDTQAD